MLREAIWAGQSTLSFAGSCVARGRGVTALYALDGGVFVPHILGAPAFVNRDFGELFAGGLPAATPLLARGEAPPAGAADRDDAAGD